MARGEGRLVKTVTYEATGDKAEIRLLKDPLRFRCQIGMDFHEDPNAEAVEAWALETLRANAEMTWTPAIEVLVHRDAEAHFTRATGRDAGVGSCSFQYRRFYLAKVADGFRQVPWNLYDAGRPQDMGGVHGAISQLAFGETGTSGTTDVGAFDGSLPYVDRGSAEYRYAPFTERDIVRALLPYDEDTWEGLAALAATLRRARAHLMGMVADPAALAGLARDAGRTMAALAPAGRA